MHDDITYLISVCKLNLMVYAVWYHFNSVMNGPYLGMMEWASYKKYGEMLLRLLTWTVNIVNWIVKLWL